MEAVKTKTKSRSRAKTASLRDEFSTILNFLDATVEKTRNAKEVFYAFVDTVAHRIARHIALRLMAYALIVFGLLFLFVGIADMIGVFFNVPGLGHIVIGGIALFSALILFSVIK
jgi:hypothetical protein